MTAPSGTEKKSVFLSHKVNDGVTSLLADLLDRHTENLDFFVSESINKKGEAWRRWIDDRLMRANFLVWVVNVVTHPNDWAWCSYEMGFFSALVQVSELRQLSELPRHHRLWCLHNASTDPPDPIADMQMIPAKKTDVELWLAELFHTTGQKASFRKAIPELADEICKLFSK
jgi:hypothetical protein